MRSADILGLRLRHTGLGRFAFASVAEAVSRLGAVQAQDFAAAKWSLGLRVRDSTDAGIEKAFNDGTVLRVHVMRPTWHLVRPEDIHWLLALTAPRVKAVLASSDRRLELDKALLAKSNAAIVRALRGRAHLTRQELKRVLLAEGIETDVQRLAHIVVHAELDGLICSGPNRGKQFTYALIDERVTKVKRLGREEALAKLALTYYSGHGPAQVKDFAWWSGLGTKDAGLALDGIRSKLRPVEVGGKTYWQLAGAGVRAPEPPPALLLSIFDEYTIAYADRGDLGEAGDIDRLIARGSAATAVIVLRGRVAGTWKKIVKKDRLELSLSVFRRLEPDERAALETQAERYRKFLGIEAVELVNKNVAGSRPTRKPKPGR